MERAFMELQVDSTPFLPPSYQTSPASTCFALSNFVKRSCKGISPVDVTGTLPSAVDSCSASYPQIR
ncbi:hypothetical protein BDL97_19G042800 [Sphagnum fallax]|nr:hypothetical protein BDL97_19G042800 [Sphagnum fallax]KAH8931850.1 hypothetical protein BDL97_19G042800 [Sphagnum fallax]